MLSQLTGTDWVILYLIVDDHQLVVRRTETTLANFLSFLGYVNIHVIRGGEEQSEVPEEHDEQETVLSATGQLSDANHKFILDKSNILLMGPTGSGDHLMSCSCV